MLDAEDAEWMGIFILSLTEKNQEYDSNPNKYFAEFEFETIVI